MSQYIPNIKYEIEFKDKNIKEFMVGMSQTDVQNITNYVKQTIVLVKKVISGDEYLY